MQMLLASIENNPTAQTPDGNLVLKTLRDKAKLEAESPDAPRPIIAACQKCGCLLVHLTERCVDCGFIPTTLEEALKAMLLGSVYINPSFVPMIGERIQRGFEFDELDGQIAGRFLIMKESIGTTHREQLQRLLDGCRAAAASPHRPINALWKCADCAAESQKHFWELTCQKCGSERLQTKRISYYKMLLRDTLLWIQKALEPQENPKLARVIADVASLKESASKGLFVQHDEGLAIQRRIQELGPLLCKQRRYRVVAEREGARGERLAEDFDRRRPRCMST
jgi:DNA-directed RNA polymerase subunit RPC12/RpoP